MEWSFAFGYSFCSICLCLPAQKNSPNILLVVQLWRKRPRRTRRYCFWVLTHTHTEAHFLHSHVFTLTMCGVSRQSVSADNPLIVSAEVTTSFRKRSPVFGSSVPQDELRFTVWHGTLRRAKISPKASATVAKEESGTIWANTFQKSVTGTRDQSHKHRASLSKLM